MLVLLGLSLAGLLLAVGILGILMVLSKMYLPADSTNEMASLAGAATTAIANVVFFGEYFLIRWVLRM